ncbi:MAG: DoxX family membrane protein [Spirochaetes bacterium]|nr:DoxX family membrane protein [Spirochaetota bacterium]
MSGESGIKRAVNSTLYGNWFTAVIRVGMGAMLLMSGLLKIMAPDSFGRLVAMYDVLPGMLVPYAAVAVPALEALLGLLLLAGFRVRSAAFVSMLLMAAFIAVIAVNVVHGRSFECGCFGLDRLGIGLSETVSPCLILRDVFFFACFAILFRAKRHVGSIESLVEKSHLKHLEKAKYE